MQLEGLSLEELIRIKDAVSARIESIMSGQRTEALMKIQLLMREHEISVMDIANSRGRRSALALKHDVEEVSGRSRGGLVKPKYRDPVTGSTWSGRGMKPKWLTARLNEGRTIEEFVV